MSDTPPRLSVAMIVRDEAEHITPCLTSLAPLGAQVVVVDTGSADATPDLARTAGAEVHFLDWPGDFAAARNESLRHCRGAWILVMDADERLDPSDLPELIAHLAGPPRGYRMVTRNYTSATHLAEFVPATPDDSLAHGFPGWFPSVKVRLFPRDPRITFSGAVHELVNASLAAAGLDIADSPVPVHHYPMERSPERVASKRQLYCALGEAKALREPQNPKAWEELAEQYLELERHADALRAYRRAVELAPREARLVAGLGAALALAGQREAAAQALDLAIRLDPGHALALRNRAVLLLQDGAPAEAEPLLRQSLAASPRDSETLRYLALSLDATGRRGEALEAVRQALAVHPGNREAAALESTLRLPLGW
ncbi:MAG: hypothetical protein RLZZ303_642 [Candidatus Hydrogenedentota bacterium]|jgi:cytochrome c-type biogenesis protein CcmH/NrfG